MPRFAYRAIDAAGKARNGAIDAGSESLALEELVRCGITPIRLREHRKGGRSLGQLLERRNRLSVTACLRMTREIARLLGSGLPLERALSVIRDTRDQDDERELLERLLKRLGNGDSLSVALAREEGGFPADYVVIVRAGELGGALAESFSRLASSMKRAHAFQRRILSALIYPAILMALLGLTLVLVVTIVLPEFEEIFREAGAELPLLTRAVMGVGEGLRDGWWLILAIVALTTLGIRHVLRDEGLRSRLDAALLCLPFAGTWIARAELGRYARTLAAMLRGGVPLATAMEIAAGTLRNRAIQSDIRAMTGRIREGKSLFEELSGLSYVRAELLQLVRIGEETGALGEALDEAANLIDEEIDVALDRGLAIFVPAITLVMGGLVALFIGSVLIGVLSINDLAI